MCLAHTPVWRSPMERSMVCLVRTLLSWSYPLSCRPTMVKVQPASGNVTKSANPRVVQPLRGESGSGTAVARLWRNAPCFPGRSSPAGPWGGQTSAWSPISNWEWRECNLVTILVKFLPDSFIVLKLQCLMIGSGAVRWLFWGRIDQKSGH